MSQTETIDCMVGLVETAVIAGREGNVRYIGIDIEKYAVIVRLDFDFAMVVVNQERFIGCNTPDEAGGSLDNIALQPPETIGMLHIGNQTAGNVRYIRDSAGHVHIPVA